MVTSIDEALADISADLHGQGCSTMVNKISDHINMAKSDLRRFIDERELSPDAVEDLEDIIKCLE